MPRIFITGGSGFIGSVVIEQAIAQGHQVYAISRTEAGDKKLEAKGAIPVRGDLKSYDVLQEQSAQADIVLHLADAFLGDHSLPYSEVIRLDKAAVDAIAAGLEGSNKPLVTTSGVLVVESTGDVTTEESPLAKKPLNDRIISEQYTLKLSEKGIRVSAIRLAPFVYGRGGSGVFLFLKAFLGAKELNYVNGGTTKTTAVNVEDAAALYLLAAEKANAGEVFNAASNIVTFHEFFEAMSTITDLPIKSLTSEEATSKYGPFLGRFLALDCQASGAKAKSQLGWDPKGTGLLDEIKTGSYVAVAEKLKNPAA
ncbi:NAD(P)-binding domain protein [Ascosphaera apis ARSEF 7405]|uniref:NAD(P)-binding domain protein n=1 Tax=Ascosphaera apis ARSEF 7405 TaxID=392613 RepID=A0A167YYB8_9EURO|nr:NAD(P)-binding domain protein [Ascosphaera apis ARSEF 7405]